jgi:two-component system, LuxR family, sensor kinase FixL
MNRPLRDTRYDVLKIFDELRSQAQQSGYFFSTLEQSTSIVAITDRAGTLEYVNPHFLETTGYAYHEAVGKNPRILHSGIHKPEFYQRLWNDITGGKEWRGEFCNRKKDGSLYWESASIYPVKGEKGTNTHYIKIADEITGRKQDEQVFMEAHRRLESKVREQESELGRKNRELKKELKERRKIERNLQRNMEFQRFLSALSMSFINIAPEKIDKQIHYGLKVLGEFMDVDSAYIAMIVNESHYRQAYGWYRRGAPLLPELIPFSTFSWTEKMTLAGDITILSSLKDAPPEGKLDMERFSALGGKSIVVIPLRLKGVTIGALAAYTEHAERRWEPETIEQFTLAGEVLVHALFRKEGEEALQKKEEELVKAQQIARLGSWDWDIPSDHHSWSAELYRICGLKQKEGAITRDTYLALTHPDDRERVLEEIMRGIAGSASSFTIEHRLVRSDDFTCYVRMQAEIVHDRDKKPLRLIGTVQDITEIREMERNLLAIRDELAHVTRIATMGELIAAIAHELNQPLCAISSNADAAARFMGRVPPHLDEIREILSDISLDARRAGDVIQRIRSMAKKAPPSHEPMELQNIIHTVLSLLKSDFIIKNIRVHSDLPPDLPMVAADRVQLQQVLLNLVINAVDAMMARDASSRSLSIKVRLSGEGFIEVAVRDSGTGVASEVFPRLFDPFFTTKPEGMGMGLAINRTIINSLGGRLWAENNADGGASFYLTIPTVRGIAP